MRLSIEDLVGRLRTVPRVTHASVSTGLPVQGTPFGGPFHLVGTPACDATSWPSTATRMVTPDFLQTFGGTIVRGRGFTDSDRAGSVRVALVSQQFADQVLRDVNPLDQRIELNEAGSPPTLGRRRSSGRLSASTTTTARSSVTSIDPKSCCRSGRVRGWTPQWQCVPQAIQTACVRTSPRRCARSIQTCPS